MYETSVWTMLALRRHRAALCAALSGLCTFFILARPGSAGAEPSDGASDRSDSIVETFAAPTSEQTWQVEWESPDEKEFPPVLRLRPSSDAAPVNRVTLPEQMAPGRRTHALRVETSRLQTAPDQHVVVLATLRPREEVASPTAETVQVAWHGTKRVGEQGSKPSKDGWTWRRAARVRHSSLDGGWRLEIRSEGVEHAGRLVRTRRGTSHRVCGRDRTSPLVTRRYAPNRKTFEKIVRLDEAIDGATSLRARLPTSPLVGPFTRGVYRWSWASAGGTSPGAAVTSPTELGDRDGATAWTVRGDTGVRGTHATARITRAVPVSGLRLVPGLAANPRDFESTGRPGALLVLLSTGDTYRVTLPDELTYASLADKRGLVVELPEPVRTRCLTVVHLGAAEGGEGRDVAISEMTPITSIDASSRADTAKRLTDRMLETPDAKRRRQLAELGAALDQSLQREIERRFDSLAETERVRLVPLLEQLDSAASASRLVELFGDLAPGTSGYRNVRRALRHHGGRAVEPLIEQLEARASDEARRIDILELLARAGSEEASTRLVATIGRGSTRLRRARIRAIRSGGSRLLEPLFASIAGDDTSPARRRDALRAIDAIARRLEGEPPHRASGAEHVLTLLRRRPDPRTAMLALHTARHFRLDGLATLLERRFADHDVPLVRRSALVALRHAASDRADFLLRRALEDPSPDVRLKAIEMIETRSNADAPLDAVLEYARNTTWPTGRRRALRVIARHRNAETERFVRDLFGAPAEAPQLVEATADAFARAERPIGLELVERVVSHDDLSQRLKAETLTLLGFGDRPAEERYLLKQLESQPNSEMTSEGSAQKKAKRHTYRAAILALGRRKSRRAHPRLWAIARDEQYAVGTRRTAIRALASYEARSVLEKLRRWRGEAPDALERALTRAIRRLERRLEERGSEEPSS